MHSITYQLILKIDILLFFDRTNKEKLFFNLERFLDLFPFMSYCEVEKYF